MSVDGGSGGAAAAINSCNNSKFG